jgi:hypothetical protein
VKKQYFAPEFEEIIFDVEDIITHSLATSNGDNGYDASNMPLPGDSRVNSDGDIETWDDIENSWVLW